MKPVDDWDQVLRYAWSIRLILVAAALDGLSSALAIEPYLLPVPMWAVAATAGVVNFAAFIARIVAQRNVSS